MRSSLNSLQQVLDPSSDWIYVEQVIWLKLFCVFFTCFIHDQFDCGPNIGVKFGTANAQFIFSSLDIINEFPSIDLYASHRISLLYHIKGSRHLY